MLVKCFAVAFVLSSNHCILRIVGLRSTQQCLQRKEGSTDGKSWRPLVFKDVQTNGTGLGTDIGVPYFGFEAHFGWLVRVFGRESDVDHEKSAMVDCVLWALDIAFPMAEVVTAE